jgi:gamma-glutamylcyclotransferase (GGCT)/AIG2-like uncharacterized protein YtfP
MNLVLCYGTLKKGYSNHRCISEQKYICKAKTAESNFQLYNVGGGAYPAAVISEKGRHIEGELYEVDDEGMKRLDWLEGVSHGLYARKSIQVIKEDDSQETAIIYIFERSTERLTPYNGSSWKQEY